MIAAASTGTQSKLKVTGNCRISCTGHLFSGVELMDRDCMTYDRSPIIQAAFTDVLCHFAASARVGAAARRAPCI